jgi:bifunctional DNA-binding transcriptional regulator/antitoxin component of YhaV-PrlF toxin-antitoxin module
VPQLVKGGKKAYAWSIVGPHGEVVIPPDARTEYGLTGRSRLIIMPGSRKSGGFALGTPDSLSRSPVGGMLSAHSELGRFAVPEGSPVEIGGKTYCWVRPADGMVVLPPPTLRRYGVAPGDRLLAVRGSGLALAFVVRGPIVEEAARHPELRVY